MKTSLLLAQARTSRETSRPRPAGGATLFSWVVAVGLLPAASAQNAYLQHNLVSDLPGLADHLDTNLVNPWGIAFSGTSPFWISDNHSGLSTLYNTAGIPQALVVNLPPTGGGTPPSAPTGIIFNGTTGFTVASNAPARFIFSTEDGTIIGWNSGTNAVLKVDNSGSGAIYKGLAFGNSGGTNYLYATDFHNGKVDIFDSNYQPATLAGSFSDPSIPTGFAPFGIENVSGQLFVTYAKQDDNQEDDVGGPGNGYVNVFKTDGTLVKRFVSAGVLDSPWGVALAPPHFGSFGGALLIGNFGDGKINAFNPATGDSLGPLNDSAGNPIAIQGLWAVKFGNGGNGGDSHTLYFTAGIPGSGAVEDHGLFGRVSALFPSFTGETNRDIVTTLNWAGGVGPFLVQKKTSLADSNWVDVITTQNRSMTLPKDSETGFYRLQNQASNTVVAFTALLNGGGEVPAVANTSATAIAMLSLEGNTLIYHIKFSGLSAPAVAAHIHSPATTTNTAGVQIPFTGVPAATEGVISGTATVTAAQVADILNGMAYVNIHTTNHPGGEIRGQVVPLRIPVALNGPSEVPPVTTSASGTGTLTLIGSQLFYDISYSGLAGPAIAAHIHGPADSTSPAPVLVPLETPAGTSGTISGSLSLNATNLMYLLSGQTYVNIHSSTNSGGEIRGQIYPVQLGATLNGASEVGPTTSPATGTANLIVLNNVLTYNVTFANLLSPAVAAHIHAPADAAHNAGVVIPFTAPATTSGVILGTAALNATNLMSLITGRAYVNIHTTNFPGGEIRGQLQPRN